MSGPEFDDLVGPEGSAEERERLRRIHELLVAAGPPPELSPVIREAPRLRERDREGFRWRPRRHFGAGLVLAGATLVAAFAVGYFVGKGGEGFQTTHEVAMHGVASAASARASLLVGERDSRGNWPLLLKVEGLKPLPEDSWYELYLTKKGEIEASCGTFATGAKLTTVRLNAPYRLKDYTGWVVGAHLHGKRAPVILMETAKI